MKLKIKLAISDDNATFMGIGLVWLVRGIIEHGSVRQAAASMGMSYPKAVKILARLEEGLGFPVIERKRGGAAGGGAVVTEKGLEFINRFGDFHQKICDFANHEFSQTFGPGD